MEPNCVLLKCLFFCFVFSFLANSFRSPQVPPTCLTLCPCSRSHSWPTLLPRTDCVSPLTPHHSAYTTATSTSQARKENSEYFSSSFCDCFFVETTFDIKYYSMMIFQQTFDCSLKNILKFSMLNFEARDQRHHFLGFKSFCISVWWLYLICTFSDYIPFILPWKRIKHWEYIWLFPGFIYFRNIH